MRCTSCVTAGFAILFAAAMAPAQETASPQPSARELFYEAVPAAPKPAQPAKPVTRPKQPPVAPPGATTPPVMTTPSAAPPASPGNALPGGGHVVPATAQTGPALGLRYTIVRLVNGRPVETLPDFAFHAGDHIQLNVQTNTPGYLYIVNRGSSGAWKPLFPAPEIANGDNYVDGWHTYTLPSPEHHIIFDEQTGTENVTIVFSRQPVPDFEEMIYSLQGHPVQPAGQPAAPATPKKMIMMASLDDATVGRLRNSASRDLIVEKVDPGTPANSGAPGDKKETAVYVVNPAGSADSRLVADLHLVHR
ncbi:MAG: DUF4384 domain-containing protein [Bryobacteraceae bacterium]